ncbi:hypothetical protein BGW80DRAFT_1314768 [Lactifluus volemus]|nr:hypothetical protein BGW80DRAFT_1314768 [Lactifluus volemus]
MLFFKFSIALLAPLAALAVPVPFDTDVRKGQPENIVTIPAQTQTMPLPQMTQRDLPSSACTDNALPVSPTPVTNQPVVMSFVPNTVTLGAFADVVSSVAAPSPTGFTSFFTFLPPPMPTSIFDPEGVFRPLGYGYKA